MKAKLLFLFLTVAVFGGCKKDKFETKPKLKLKKAESYLVTTTNGTGSVVDIEFEVTDKEGDVQDSIYMQKIDAALNPCPANSILTNLDYKIPDFPKSANQAVTFRVRFSTLNLDGYALIGGPSCSPRKDTSRFTFVVKDKAGNKSDTLKTDPIAIK
jgi:hypothetical protein